MAMNQIEEAVERDSDEDGEESRSMEGSEKRVLWLTGAVLTLSVFLLIHGLTMVGNILIRSPFDPVTLLGLVIWASGVALVGVVMFRG